MELIDTTRNDNYTAKRFLVSKRDKEDKVVERIKTVTDYKTGEHHEHTSTFIKQKFLCVNGPKVGQKFLAEEAGKLGYVLYNCAENRRWVPKKYPSAVLVIIPK